MSTALPLLAAPAHAAAAGVSTLGEITAEANWIESAQMPSGPIAVWPDRPELLRVEPYQANYAAIGLARASQLTGNMSYANAAWSYLQWYSSAEQAGTGYVTDYTISDGTQLTSTGGYDSTDAYAGTFLTAVWDTYVATRSESSLATISSGVAGALSAIASTQQPDGLTWATPSYQVAYLMDQAETFGGLEAASEIEEALGNSHLAMEAETRAAELEAGIQSLWNEAGGSYNWAMQANGYEQATNWSNFYPDGLEQVWAVAWGLVPSSRANALMSRFVTEDPQWDNPTASANYLTNATMAPQPVSYWPEVAIALNAVGGEGTAATGLASELAAADEVNNAWPFTVGDAGEAIVAASGMPLLLSNGGYSGAAATQGGNPTPTTSASRPSAQAWKATNTTTSRLRPVPRDRGATRQIFAELTPASHGPARRSLSQGALLLPAS